MKLSRRRNAGGNKEPSPRAMRCIIRVLLPIALLLVTAHRLPAPISEIPEATATARPKAKPNLRRKRRRQVRAQKISCGQPLRQRRHQLLCLQEPGLELSTDEPIAFSAGTRLPPTIRFTFRQTREQSRWRKRATLPATCRNHKSHAAAKEIV